MPAVDISTFSFFFLKREGELLRAIPIQQMACYCHWGTSNGVAWVYRQNTISHRVRMDPMSSPNSTKNLQTENWISHTIIILIPELQ